MTKQPPQIDGWKPRSCPPPSGFKSARDPRNVRFTFPPPFVVGSRQKGARAAGLRYERKAQDKLERRYGIHYVRAPWIRFTDGGKQRLCQPDGLLFAPRTGILTIVEIKLRHTSDAAYQLIRLYGPVVSQMFPERLWSIRFTEVVRWYDPATSFPYPHKLREKIHDTPRKTIGVHILSL